MGLRKRDSKAGPKPVKKQYKKKPRTAQEIEDSKNKRRELYHRDEEFRQKVKDSARKYYRKLNPKPATAIDDGSPAIPATAREVTLIGGGGTPEYRNCYTVPELAEALGKTLVTTRSWISRGYLPDAQWVDVRHGYKQYTEEEVMGLIRALVEHFKVYAYLNENHQEALQAIAQNVEQARGEQ